ncbi:hypothetical protein ANCCAN_02995 [Ancylostoma caninum]|uniref:Uncharacterized protein n=1 Tax=Ancylostoma caninum TaxID=29170 RepID=A0A368H2J1_ANCCA|nr:hypothetical protein ANCCAN_02995 [Ancylostoma caninum]
MKFLLIALLVLFVDAHIAGRSDLLIRTSVNKRDYKNPLIPIGIAAVGLGAMIASGLHAMMVSNNLEADATPKKSKQ